MPRFKPQQDTIYTRLCIVGAGPTGLGAAAQASSEGLQTIVLESQPTCGGQAKHSSRIENYPGFPGGISGPALMSRYRSQAMAFGVEIMTDSRAVSHVPEGAVHCLSLSNGTHVLSHAVLIASGLEWRKLQAENIDNFLGKGVFYGAAMDTGPSLKGKNVSIVGGANSAAQAALWFAKFADSITMLVRGSSFRDSMSAYLIDRILKHPKIEVRFNSSVEACHGSGELKSIVLREDKCIMSCDALFVFIGAVPHTEWLSGVCNLESGFIETDTSNATSCAGIFAAGDVRLGSTKRVASGVGDGAHAVSAIHRYLDSIGKGV